MKAVLARYRDALVLGGLFVLALLIVALRDDPRPPTTASDDSTAVQAPTIPSPSLRPIEAAPEGES